MESPSESLTGRFPAWAETTHKLVTTPHNGVLRWTYDVRPPITHFPTGMVMSVQLGPHVHSSGVGREPNEVRYRDPATTYEIMVQDWGEYEPNLLLASLGFNTELYEPDGPHGYVPGWRIARVFSDSWSMVNALGQARALTKETKGRFYPTGRRKIEIC